MTRTRHTRTAIAVAITASLALPGAALARGGGSTPPPPPPPTVEPVLCDYTADGLVDTGYTFSNQVGDAGCVTAVSTWSGVVRLYAVKATPGWSWTSNTTTDGVKVSFTNISTGARAEIRVEPGKTDIRA